MPTEQRRLSRHLIVDVALEIADDDGLDAVTLATIASVAGGKAPSLYNHVNGLDDLLDELCLRATDDFSNALRDSVVAKVGRDAVRSYAQAWRTYVLRRPGRYRATLRPLPHRRADHGSASAGMTIPAGSILSTLGIPDDRLDDAGRALRSTLHGFSVLELTNTIGPTPDRSFESVVDTIISGLESLAN